MGTSSVGNLRGTQRELPMGVPWATVMSLLDPFTMEVLQWFWHGCSSFWNWKPNCTLERYTSQAEVDAAFWWFTQRADEVSVAMKDEFLDGKSHLCLDSGPNMQRATCQVPFVSISCSQTTSDYVTWSWPGEGQHQEHSRLPSLILLTNDY